MRAQVAALICVVSACDGPAGPEGSCSIDASFTYSPGGQTTVFDRAVDTGAGWLLAYEIGYPSSPEVWWTAVSYAGATITPPTGIAGGASWPLLAVDGDRALLVFDVGGEWRAQRLTSAGVAIGTPFALAGLPGGRVTGIVADPGNGFRALWYRTTPSQPPQPPGSGEVAIVQLDHDGNPIGGTSPAVMQRANLGNTAALPDGSLAVVSRNRYALAGCLACSTDGLMQISAAGAVTDHGLAPIPPDHRDDYTTITVAGTSAYASWVAVDQNGFDAIASIARFPFDTVATIPGANPLVITGTGPATGAVGYRADGLDWVRRFTDDGTFTLGTPCPIDIQPDAIARRDLDAVVVASDGQARVVSVP